MTNSHSRDPEDSRRRGRRRLGCDHCQWLCYSHWEYDSVGNSEFAQGEKISHHQERRKDLLFTRPTHLQRQIVHILRRCIEVESRAVRPAPIYTPSFFFFFSSSRREVAFVSDRWAKDGKGIRVLGTACNGNFDCAVGHGEIDETLSWTLGGW